MSSPRSLCRLAASASRQARPLQRQTRSLFSSAAPSRTTQVPAVRRMQWPSARNFSVSAVKPHGHITPPKPGEELWVTFVDKDGDEHKIAVSEGDNLLEIAQENDLEMEGACGGSCACSTCHVIVVDEEHYEKMPEPEDDENDMLDLAFGLTETSRLGCQVTMTKELDGLRIKLPPMTRNLQASDFS
ncbi:2fe-2s iron-sulfur cluster binding domain protein [Colletotrichum karsti]|uniref:2fe-2s iron-sulfur cluster binding domain protein n=1 Tax=Colletotrichum karsti TaxID=1095194 RepID=A0A9P6LKY0_9PEZI|nr:2fe-2s iron-sulfur cluster binding domain protein [Colletotrichum karsti]KAF9877198.1 2fe-2s iron-sulfur cluster binding domain protein [Colletotrichum karsti]